MGDFMSLKNVQEYFIDAITDINADLLYLDNLIKDKELHIEEILLFIKEIEKDMIDDTVLSPIFIENDIKDKIAKEKSKIEADQKDILDLKGRINTINDKKKILELLLDSTTEYLAEDKVFVSKDLIKDQISFNNNLKEDIDSRINSMKKSIDSYIRVDYKRVQIEYDKFQKDFKNIIKNIDDNNSSLDKILI